MNIYTQQDNTITIVVITLMVLSLILLVLKMLLTTKKKQEEKDIKIDEDYINSLYNALGTKTNIIKISLENKRLKVQLKDPKQINKENFDKINTPAFLTGDELKILVKHDQNKVLEQLEKLRKEE